MITILRTAFLSSYGGWDMVCQSVRLHKTGYFCNDNTTYLYKLLHIKHIMYVSNDGPRKLNINLTIYEN